MRTRPGTRQGLTSLDELEEKLRPESEGGGGGGEGGGMLWESVGKSIAWGAALEEEEEEWTRSLPADDSGPK